MLFSGKSETSAHEFLSVTPYLIASEKILESICNSRFIVEGFLVLPFSNSASLRSFLYFSNQQRRNLSKRLALKTLALTDHRKLVLLIIFERTFVLPRPGFIVTLYKLLERCLTSRSTISSFVNLLANLRLSLLGLDLGPCLEGALPDNGRRGYRTRSAICLPVCVLAFSLSFPEVQPRAPAVYNMIRILIAVFCGERWERRETKLTRCNSNSTSNDVASVANFQRRENFSR